MSPEHQKANIWLEVAQGTTNYLVDQLAQARARIAELEKQLAAATPPPPAP